MKLNDFDYILPPELIAQEPIEKREFSRLLVYKDNTISHKHFHQISDYLNKGDLLVLNNTKVIPARLYGKKINTGGKVELLLIEEKGEGIWKCLAKPSRRLNRGSKVSFSDGLLEGTIIDREDDGSRIIKFEDKDYKEKLFQIGEMPLPPYIKKTLIDKNRYQTVYSETSGSIAAPTAGLHFTEELLNELKNKGVIISKVTLHVGLGTFRPVKTDNIEEHKMEEELVYIPKEEADKINDARERGGKIIAVGTTAVRSLETAADEKGFINEIKAKTRIFIYPGYKFKSIDGLITNFHLPKSTLFMLVSAFIGKDNAHKIYREAINNRYRFYSFGDACLFLKS